LALAKGRINGNFFILLVIRWLYCKPDGNLDWLNTIPMITMMITATPVYRKNRWNYNGKEYI
jgi:hypothetical protein